MSKNLQSIDTPNFRKSKQMRSLRSNLVKSELFI